MGPQPYSCTPERGVKVSRWVLATPQLLVGFATDNNWCGSRFSGQWSQQGWLKDHRGLCLDKGTADMVCCGCANILGSPTILGQLGTGQQGKSDTCVLQEQTTHPGSGITPVLVGRDVWGFVTPCSLEWDFPGSCWPNEPWKPLETDMPPWAHAPKLHHPPAGKSVHASLLAAPSHLGSDFQLQ